MDVDLGHLTKPCACGRKHPVFTEHIDMESGAATRLFEILKDFQNPIFICDTESRAAAEPFLEEEFKDYLVIELDPEGLKADEEGIRTVMDQLEICDRGLSSVPVDILVAIGTDIIHELTRYAAIEYRIPYVSIPTAASTDTFASCAVNCEDADPQTGQTLCAPRWILADADIYTNAPNHLTAAGAACVLQKKAARDVWRQEHKHGDTYFCERAYTLIDDAVDVVEHKYDAILAGEKDAVTDLMRALLKSGLVMQMLALAEGGEEGEASCIYLDMIRGMER